MDAIDQIGFHRQRTDGHLRHYVDDGDIKTLLLRLPPTVWQRLRRIVFLRNVSENRRISYTTGKDRTEIHLCALPHTINLTPFLSREQSAEDYGALRESNWPVKAIRRFVLYNVILQELGHLQVVAPDAPNPRGRFAAETAAQQFAQEWRERLWSEACDPPDPVHQSPTREEIDAVERGWAIADNDYMRGYRRERQKEHARAFSSYQNAVEAYADHALALEAIGKLTYAGHGPEAKEERLAKAVKWLERALALDPTLPDASLYLAMINTRMEKPQIRVSSGHTFVMDPCQTVSLTNYAEKLSERGYGDEAEDLFQKVLNKVPGKDSRRDRALRAYARMLLYRSGENSNEQAKKAVDLLREAVRINPTDAPNHFYLGLAYSWVKGHERDALEHVRESLRLRPDFEAATELLVQLEDGAHSS